MALYEYHCSSCGNRFDKRMPMSEVLQLVACSCGQMAKKTLGGFAVIGRAEASVGDGPAPWDAGGSGDEGDFGGDDFGDAGDFGGHGGHGHSHSYAHGADTHSHGF